MPAYSFTHRVNAKGRWLGKPLREVLQHEFSAQSAEYWEGAAGKTLWLEERPKRQGKRSRERGAEGAAAGPAAPTRIPFTLDTIVTPNTVLVHTAERHEPPIPYAPVPVTHAADGVLVIDKPVGVQMHPSGAARLNTLVYIAQAEGGLPALPRLAYRLDRVTSGLVLAGQDAQASRHLASLLSQPACTKAYLVRVAGNVAGSLAGQPASLPTLPTNTAPSTHSLDARGAPAYRPSDFRALGGAPIDLQGDGCAWWHGGVPRPSHSSMRAAVPVTPQTLQVDDSLAPDCTGLRWAEEGVGGAAPRTALVAAPIALLNPRIGLHTVHPAGKPASTTVRVLAYHAGSDTSLVQAVPLTGRTHQIRLHMWWLGHPVVGDAACGWAPRAAQEGLAPTGGVCLHALRYSGEGWAFSVPPPAWAQAFLAREAGSTPTPGMASEAGSARARTESEDATK